MFKYGISYYTVENGERKPESGVDVRLLRPGADWQTGIPLIETGDTGYYECFIVDEKDCGFYEIWDNRNDPIGSFSGKYCTIGKLDKEYNTIPHVILSSQCNCFLYIADIKIDGTQITITIGIGQLFDADLAKYQLMILPL